MIAEQVIQVCIRAMDQFSEAMNELGETFWYAFVGLDGDPKVRLALQCKREVDLMFVRHLARLAQ